MGCSKLTACYVNHAVIRWARLLTTASMGVLYETGFKCMHQTCNVYTHTHLQYPTAHCATNVAIHVVMIDEQVKFFRVDIISS